MGTDREARALGAGDILEVNGERYTLRPVVVRQLCDLEREALHFYKREVLETYHNNLDLVGGSVDTSVVMEKKLEEVASWDVSNMPQKRVYDTSNLPITSKLREWIMSEFEIEESSEIVSRAVLSLSLDIGRITVSKVKELTGAVPLQGSVRYDQWWITASTEGMTRFVFASLQKEHGGDLTYDTISTWPYTKLVEASRLVEKITVAQMGNG